MSDGLSNLQIVALSYPQAEIKNNNADILYLLPGTTEVILNPPSIQRKFLVIFNKALGFVAIDTGSIVPLETQHQQYLTLMGNYITNEWEVVQSGFGGDFELWALTGNTFHDTSNIGTINNHSVSIIRNNIEFINVADGTVTIGTGVPSITNVPVPIESSSFVNKNYIDGIPSTITPTMTSYTTAAGNASSYRVSANSAFNNDYAGWKAFRNLTSGGGNNEWAVLGNVNGTLDLFYPTPTYVVGFNIRGRTNGDDHWDSWNIQGSNDGVIFTTLFTSATRVPNTFTNYVIPSPNYFVQYRLNGTSPAGGNPGLSTLQYLSNSTITNPISVTPTMTSNTTPSPYVVVASNELSVNYQGWKVFRNLTSGGDLNEWVTATGINATLDFFYPTPTYVSSFNIINRIALSQYWNNWKISASNDNNTFTDLYVSSTRVPTTFTNYIIQPPGYYNQYRFSGFTATGNPGLGSLQYLNGGTHPKVIANLTDRIDPFSIPTKNYVTFNEIELFTNVVGCTLSYTAYRLADAVLVHGSFESSGTSAISMEITGELKPTSAATAFMASATAQETRGLGFIWSVANSRFENNFNAPATSNGSWAFTVFWVIY